MILNLRKEDSRSGTHGLWSNMWFGGLDDGFVIKSKGLRLFHQGGSEQRLFLDSPVHELAVSMAKSWTHWHISSVHGSDNSSEKQNMKRMRGSNEIYRISLTYPMNEVFLSEVAVDPVEDVESSVCTKLRQAN